MANLGGLPFFMSFERVRNTFFRIYFIFLNFFSGYENGSPHLCMGWSLMLNSDFLIDYATNQENFWSFGDFDNSAMD